MATEKSITAQVLELIQADGLTIGSHLPAQTLADRLRVSRTPVNDALGLLHEKGVLRRERNRGYFLAQPVQRPLAELVDQLGLQAEDVVDSTYFRIADDRLRETDTADQIHDRGVRLHESLVEASGNVFSIDTVRRVNRVRRPQP